MKLVLSKTRAIDFRVSTLPTLQGEKIVMRILDPTSATLGIEALGYEPEQKATLLDAISRPYGMVLVTGPTGSGKTVSLYTCLNILNKDGINISTAEDPAEINLAGINQVNVDDRAGLTFPVALKAFCVRIRTSSWSVKFVTWKPLKFRSRLPRPATWCCPPAHQRCTADADPPDEHGRPDLQHRLQRAVDYRTAPGTPPVQLQKPMEVPARPCLMPAIPRATSTARGHCTGPAAANAAREQVTRGGSASIRSCRFPRPCNA
jgi:energy-coupling factor transporter ATP-binding protein EcfA2